MNREEVKALIAEWTHKPPGSRPLLEKAIADQYRKSREGQWLGFRSDGLLDWLREAVAGIDVDEEDDSELERRVARLLTEDDGDTETCAQELPLAALRATSEHGVKTANLPDDEEIGRKVRTILDRLDAGGSGLNPK